MTKSGTSDLSFTIIISPYPTGQPARLEKLSWNVSKLRSNGTRLSPPPRFAEYDDPDELGDSVQRSPTPSNAG